MALPLKVCVAKNTIRNLINFFQFLLTNVLYIRDHLKKNKVLIKLLLLNKQSKNFIYLFLPIVDKEVSNLNVTTCLVKPTENELSVIPEELIQANNASLGLKNDPQKLYRKNFFPRKNQYK